MDGRWHAAHKGARFTRTAVDQSNLAKPALPYTVADVSPPNKPRTSCRIRGRKLEKSVLKRSPRIAVIVVLSKIRFTGSSNYGYRMEHANRAITTRSRTGPSLGLDKKIPAEAGIKKCGNHLLSPFDYHRPCRLNFRVRNGNGCIPARIVTARSTIHRPLRWSSPPGTTFPRRLALMCSSPSFGPIIIAHGGQSSEPCGIPPGGNACRQ